MKFVSAISARAALLACAWLVLSAQGPAETPDAKPANSLAGQLLVAAPNLGDLRFDGAVVYLVHHDASGAFGVVINHPLRSQKFADLLAAVGQNSTTATGEVKVFLGGPLETEIGFVLHTTDYSNDMTFRVDSRFALTSNAQILRDLAAGKGPKQSLIAFGYAGWAPGQLEDELGHNDWYVAPADAALLFDADRDSVWQRAFDRKTLRL
jgi:putative transcriptional regulator